jgi:hypothetical protein
MARAASGVSRRTEAFTRRTARGAHNNHGAHPSPARGDTGASYTDTHRARARARSTHSKLPLFGENIFT